MLFRLAYLSVVSVFAVLRLLPGSDRDKDAEILALRHQLAVVQRQLGGQKIRFSPADRALLAAPLHHLPSTIWVILRQTGIDPAPNAPPPPGRTSCAPRPKPCRRGDFVRDRDAKYPPLFDAVLADAGIAIVLSGIRTPHMNSIMERRGLTCRRELLDRTLVWNQRHPLHAFPQYEAFHNAHRPHQGIADARPLTPLPEPITDPGRLTHLQAHRPDRHGGILRENHHAA